MNPITERWIVICAIRYTGRPWINAPSVINPESISPAGKPCDTEKETIKSVLDTYEGIN